MTPPAPTTRDRPSPTAPPGNKRDRRPSRARSRIRPVHMRPSYLAVVLVGGIIGTSAREGLVLAFDPVDGVPWVIFVINVCGAFLLGLLLDSLARRGLTRGRARTMRLLLGTGVLGGFTTYSALATDTAHLIGNGDPGRGMAYALLTVFVGALATWCGIAVAALAHHALPADVR